MIKRIEVGLVDANCYIIAAENNDAAAIDVGGDFRELILPYLEKHGLKLKKILLTHGHFDHVLGVADAVRETGAEVFVHEADGWMLGRETLSAYPGGDGAEITDFTTVSDGGEVTLHELNFKVLSTPGHTPGSVCYMLGDMIFTGDTLFYGSIGRTDFPFSNPTDMEKSLKKLTALDGEVFPGHGDPTTMERERRENPYLCG